MLCSLCQKLGSYCAVGPAAESQALPGYNLEYLEKSDDCPVCKLFRARAFAYPGVDEDGISVSIRAGRGVHLGKKGQGSGIYHNFFPFCTPASTLESDQVAEARGITLFPGRLSYTKADSDECMDLANSWLRQCLDSHERCSKIAAQGRPTRFLDLGGDKVKLATTMETGSNYVALSHTWGKVHPLTTTSSTLQDRLTAIPISDLPPTFRDAVFVTRKLGCRYLWIDSLCIIQDSHEDWETESSKMHDVYRGALVTISALHGANSLAGLFTERMPKTYVELPLPENSMSKPIYLTTDPESRHDLLKRSILSSRGWTLQERLLSPRLLHFSEDEILWDCLTCASREASRTHEKKIIRSESTANYAGPEVHLNMPPFDWSKQPEMLSILNEWGGADSKNPFELWYLVVSMFSGRNLTYSKDKFPALSGLAAEMRAQTQYTYVAGLWKEDFLAGLCWHLYPGVNTSTIKRSSEYRAPSWSWGSLDGKVEYCGETLVHMFDPIPKVLDPSMSPEIMRIQAIPAGRDTAGAVDSGFVTMRALLVDLSIKHKPSFARTNRVQLSINSFAARALQGALSFFGQGDAFSFDGVLDSIGDSTLTTCIGLPVTVREKNSLDQVICLLITEAAEQPGWYRRVGLAWMRTEHAQSLFAGLAKFGKTPIKII